MKVSAGIAGVLILCVLAALAGLTAGINLNPQATVKFVPDWGSAADWVAGIGTLFAVVLALKVRLEDMHSQKEQLEALTYGVLNIGRGTSAMGLEVTSKGRLPVRITGMYLGSRKEPKIWAFDNYLIDSSALPVRLEFGDKIDFRFTPELKGLVKKAEINDMAPIKREDMMLFIETTLGGTQLPLDLTYFPH